MNASFNEEDDLDLSDLEAQIEEKIRGRGLEWRIPTPTLPTPALDEVEEFVKARSLEFTKATEEFRTQRRVAEVAKDLGKWL